VRFDFGFKTYDPANEIGKNGSDNTTLQTQFKFWYNYPNANNSFLQS
jgi:hypothetical protein